MSVNRGWNQVNKAWDNLSKRERLLIVVTTSMMPLMLLFVFVLEPALERLQGVDEQISSLELSVQTQEQILRQYQGAALPDPNAAANSKLMELVRKLEGLDTDLDDFSRKLVGPQQMLGLLHSVLGSEEGLRIIDASSLPVEPLVMQESEDGSSVTAFKAFGLNTDAKDATRAQAMKEAVIYIHPFELRLEGDYNALYKYLLKIEQLHQGFFWDKLEYKAGTYPNAEILLRVHTLSTEDSWLGA